MWGGKEGLRQEMQELGSEMGLEAVLVATDLSMPQPPEPELRDHPESPPHRDTVGLDLRGEGPFLLHLCMVSCRLFQTPLCTNESR